MNVKSRWADNIMIERCHSAVGNVPPASVYYPTMLYNDALESVGHYAA